MPHRKQRVQTSSLVERHHCLCHLIDRVALHQPVAVNAMNRPASRIEKAQIVVNLRRRCHRGSRIPRRVLLLDCNCRRKAVDLVHIGLLDALQKLPRVCRKRLHVAPLALGVYRVESKRALA